VELTRIFDAKVKAFMKTVLKAGGGSGVLGRVTDYVIRYEVGLQPSLAPWQNAHLYVVTGTSANCFLVTLHAFRPGARAGTVAERTTRLPA
jgi:hypothetical protein